MNPWKIRKVGSTEVTVLPRNPVSSIRKKQGNVQYEELLTGGYSRLSNQEKIQKEEYQLTWAALSLEEVQGLEQFLNEKVEITNHLLEVSIGYMDSLEKQHLITIDGSPQYGVQVVIREI